MRLMSPRWLGKEFDALLREEPLLAKAYKMTGYPGTKRHGARSETLPFGTLWLSGGNIGIDEKPGGNTTLLTAELLRLRVLRSQRKTPQEAFNIILSRYT